MQHSNASRHAMLGPSFLLAAALSISIGCGGGGGGDDSGGGSPQGPSPTPVHIPVDPPVASPRAHATGRAVVENGDVTSDGFEIGNIEDAGLADDGSLALIAAEDRGNERAIVRRSAAGELTTVFDSSNAPDEVDLTTLSRLRMAPTGEIAFQSGEGLDSDQLHRVLAGGVETIAGTAGATAPDFRILGRFRIIGNRVAFVGGGGDCELDTTSDTPRDLCTLALFLADGPEVVRIDHPDFELDRRQANDAEIAMNAAGDLFFSLPGRRTSPVVVRFDGEQTEAIAINNGELPGVGRLGRIDVVDLDSQGRLLVELGIRPENPDDPVLDHVGLLDGGDFVDFQAEGDAIGDRTIFAVRAIGLGGGRALFGTTLHDPATGQQSICLRLGNASGSIEIACEGDPFPGEEMEIFSIGSARINSAGDVLFVTALGSRSDGTTRIEEIRATVRRANGDLVTIVSSAEGDQGVITELTTVGFNNAGQALLIAERSRSSDRVLFLGDSR